MPRWLFWLLVARVTGSAVMELGRSFIYKRVMAQQQKGGGWRVVKNVVKHGNGSVTNNVIESGLTRPRAISLTKSLNRPNGVNHG